MFACYKNSLACDFVGSPAPRNQNSPQNVRHHLCLEWRYFVLVQSMVVCLLDKYCYTRAPLPTKFYFNFSVACSYHCMIFNVIFLEVNVLIANSSKNIRRVACGVWRGGVWRGGVWCGGVWCVARGVWRVACGVWRVTRGVPYKVTTPKKPSRSFVVLFYKSY